MQLDATADPRKHATAGTQARLAEVAGYDGLTVTETAHDPFLQIALAAVATERIELLTGIAVAFARSPMTLAHLGYDLQEVTRGRFVLGLGSQVKAHVTKRFSMPWGRPAMRMREMVLAVRAIWAGWQDGSPLNFEGEFYTHTLMTPMFTPVAHAYGPPRVRLAAVGEAMTRVAGEVADGVICHPFTTPDYVREVTLPALKSGAERAGKDVSAIEIVGMPIVGLAATAEQRSVIEPQIRQQTAFYASTPAYRPVLELHGRAGLQEQLRAASLEGEWQRMAELVDDDVLALFAVIGNADEIAREVRDRYSSLFTRISLYTPYDLQGGDVDDVQRAYATGVVLPSMEVGPGETH